MAAARAVTDLQLPLTINVVLHRGNIGRIGQLVDLAAALGANRLELAHTQYYGWALLNRSALLPTREQIVAAEQAVAQARAAHGAALEIFYVVADYYESYPKPCMHGWERRHIVITPDGRALPCPAAGQISGLDIDNVRARTGRDLAPLHGVHPVSRVGMDGATGPELPAQGDRLRWLPLPGFPTHRGHRPDGPGVPAVARPPSGP